MSITRCTHCDNQYDQDTAVEHEEMCGQNKKVASSLLDYIAATIGIFYKDYVHPSKPDYDEDVRDWNRRGSFPGEIESFIVTTIQGAYSQGYQDGATRLQKDTIKEILCEVRKNGSADRQSIIIELTKKYKKLTGIDIPK